MSKAPSSQRSSRAAGCSLGWLLPFQRSLQSSSASVHPPVIIPSVIADGQFRGDGF